MMKRFYVLVHVILILFTALSSHAQETDSRCSKPKIAITNSSDCDFILYAGRTRLAKIRPNRSWSARVSVGLNLNGGTLGITTTDLEGTDGYDISNYTSTFGGTSSATPLVSGVIALMLEANPNLTWRDVQHLLVENAVKIDANNADWTTNNAGFDINHNYGFGGVDAALLAQNAASWINKDPLTSDTSNLLTFSKPIPDSPVTGQYGAVADTIITIASDIKKLEHVELIIDGTHTYWGDLRVKLTSPSGTESVLALPRSNSQDMQKWTYMTVRNWGEDPDGDWSVEIDDAGNEDAGTWESAQIILHGVNPNCSPTSTLTEVEVASGYYKSAIDLDAIGTVKAGINVGLQAGNSVTLNSNFEVEDNGTLLVSIGGCND